MSDIVTQLETKVLKLIEELETTRTSKQQLETENDGLRITVADHDRLGLELRAANERIATLSAEKAELEPHRGASEERDTLRADLEAIRGELAAARNELEAARARIAEVENSFQEVSRHRDELSGRLDTANGLIGLAEMERNASFAERDRALGEVGVVVRERDHARSRASELEEWHAGVCKHRDEIQGKLEATNGELASAKSRAAELEQWLKDTGTHRDEMQRALETATVRVGELEKAAHDSGAELDQVRKQLDDTGFRVLELEEELLGVTRERDSFRTKVEELASQVSMMNGSSEEMEELRAERDRLLVHLKDSSERDSRMRERLTMLIDRIQAAEDCLAQLELAHETA